MDRGRPLTAADVDRFWSKVDQSGGPEACWSWTAARFTSGAGAFKAGGKQYHAPRIAVELTTGVSLGQLLACHHCDNPPCCNPAHLFVGTHLDNARDRTAKGRSQKGDHVPAERRPRGESHPDHRLTEEQVRAIRTARAEGVSLGVLAGRYGVVKNTIKFAATGHTWRHVR